MMKQEPWAIFLSGRGSNAQAAFDLLGEIKISLCVASKPGTWGAARAKRAGVPTQVLSKPLDWQKIETELQKYNIKNIFLLGFMHLIPASFLKNWKGRIINLHPSLLPLYPGLHSIEKSHAEGAKMGITIHHVVEEMDAGPVIMQKQILPAALEGKHPLTLSEAQFLISITEQRSVQTTLLRLNQGPSSWN